MPFATAAGHSAAGTVKLVPLTVPTASVYVISGVISAQITPGRGLYRPPSSVTSARVVSSSFPRDRAACGWREVRVSLVLLCAFTHF